MEETGFKENPRSIRKKDGLLEMYKTKKEIEKWIKAFNAEQVERMRADNYLDYIDEDNLNGFERFRGGGEWSVELVAPQALLDLLPEWERSCWWEVDVVIDDDGDYDDDNGDDDDDADAKAVVHTLPA